VPFGAATSCLDIIFTNVVVGEVRLIGSRIGKPFVKLRPARAARHVGSHGGVSAPVCALQGKPRVAAKEETAVTACRTRRDVQPLSPEKEDKPTPSRTNGEFGGTQDRLLGPDFDAR
jgi:hypothetical protein